MAIGKDTSRNDASAYMNFPASLIALLESQASLRVSAAYGRKVERNGRDVAVKRKQVANENGRGEGNISNMAQALTKMENETG